MVLAHGLFGFSELRIAGGWLPAVHYWHGITDALIANGVEVITTAVPPVSAPMGAVFSPLLPSASLKLLLSYSSSHL